MRSEALARGDDRLDRLVNLDVGGRGVEPLFDAARELQGASLVGAAADALLAVPEGGTVVVSTGSVSRAWLSPAVGENDGPSGAAAIVRALALGRRATCVVVAEESLLGPIGAVVRAAGVTILAAADARAANDDGSLAAASLRAFPVTDAEGPAAAAALLDELRPDLLFATERVGRNVNGVYYSMRGRDYGRGRARIDDLFDEGLRRGVPVVAVGDGGNEIGMGKVAEAVRAHVPHGAEGSCPCGGGIGAVTGADVLVTAAVSNWGCTAITAALAARTGDARLLHTPEREARLLAAMSAAGLIDSSRGLVDDAVDGIAPATHVAVAELCRALVAPALS